MPSRPLSHTGGQAPITIVDAFADGPFTGNPAAVVVLESDASAAWMQSVAMEMNQAETAFVRRISDDAWSLRWFTPLAEVDLCGHATLGTAHALWESGASDEATIAFDTRSGRLTAGRESGGMIVLDFPAIASTRTEPPPSCRDVLGVEPDEVLMGAFDLLVVLPDADAVRRLAPDLARIAAWPVRGVLVTAPGASDGVDFVSRCFFPSLGVPEDPVTGSAHCALAPWWAGQLHKADLVGVQLSRRGGRVGCRVVGERVELRGRAVTTVRGSLTV
ncbi:MAG: PhzF family phenazine biosynthesis protein [Gemmatimonadota bacterium]